MTTKPFKALTLTCSPCSISPDKDSARQVSPTTLTSPLGFNSVVATPILPAMYSGPVSLERRLIGPITHLTYKPARTPKTTSRLSSITAISPNGDGEYGRLKDNKYIPTAPR